MFDRLIAAIRVKSREEWVRMLREKWMNVRIWIQEHGELAAVAALIVGAAIILAFSLVLWLVIICVITGFIVWSVALPEEQSRNQSVEPHSGNDSEQ